MSKGSKKRPTLVSNEENTLRWKLALGEITFDEYNKQYKQLKKEGKIKCRI